MSMAGSTPKRRTPGATGGGDHFGGLCCLEILVAIFATKSRATTGQKSLVNPCQSCELCSWYVLEWLKESFISEFTAPFVLVSLRSIILSLFFCHYIILSLYPLNVKSETMFSQILLFY